MQRPTLRCATACVCLVCFGAALVVADTAMVGRLVTQSDPGANFKNAFDDARGDTPAGRKWAACRQRGRRSIASARLRSCLTVTPVVTGRSRRTITTRRPTRGAPIGLVCHKGLTPRGNAASYS